jgi:hypothetical protein
MRALRRRRTWSGTVPVAGESPARPRPVAKPDKQVAVAVLEAYSISGAFLRLSLRGAKTPIHHAATG